jgi:hypothetical protein
LVPGSFIPQPTSFFQRFRIRGCLWHPTNRPISAAYPPAIANGEAAMASKVYFIDMRAMVQENFTDKIEPFMEAAGISSVA